VCLEAEFVVRQQYRLGSLDRRVPLLKTSAWL
jgi:hypothetical protein